jgi:membrane protein YdbS with pleckstrin-like domain
MYGTSPAEPDALAIRSGLLRHRHFVVPAAAIETIDERTRVIGLRLESQDLTRFL